MFEYGIINLITKEEKILFGRGIKDAFARHPELNPEEWKISYCDYID